MGCTSSKPNDIKMGAHIAQPEHSFDPTSENGSFAYDYAAPASIIGNQGFAPKTNALDNRWQLQSSSHQMIQPKEAAVEGRIRRVHITVETDTTPTKSPQLHSETPFDYKPPLTAMTADSKQSYFMYAESSEPDIRAPREESGIAEERGEAAFGRKDCSQGDEESTTSGDEGAPINHSSSQRNNCFNDTLGPRGSSRRLDETWLEFHNAGRSDADATDIQEERINEALVEEREREGEEEPTPAEAGDTNGSHGDHHTESHHSHSLSHPQSGGHKDQVIVHSSSGKLTTIGNALQSQDDLAHSPVHRNANVSLVFGRHPRPSIQSEFPLVRIDQPAPFLSKSRHESVRDWLVHIDLSKQKEPVSPQTRVNNTNVPAIFNFSDFEDHNASPPESDPITTISKKISGNTLLSFHNHLVRGSVEGMTEDTATNRSSPSTAIPTLVMGN